MDSFSLKTASAYINNLLLARGLLRDGTSIEFARPAKGAGGADATMARVINLVHDLILRRDRDQTHHESLAHTLRALRTDLSASTTAASRLETQLADAQRQVAAAQSQDRASRAALRAAEASNRALRDEAARLRATAGQVRAACANDVRKRDVQIQRLKGHLTAQQRGNRGGVVGASITITPGASVGGAPLGGGGGVGREAEGAGVEDPGYSLKQETTEFLTQLSQELSDENDGLIGLVRSTISTLRELQGLSEDMRKTDSESSEEKEHEDEGATAMTQTLPTSYDSLATDMDGLLENLRNLLTNPNFVSIDEVESREEEIARLRTGWDKMETRFKEAIGMMEVWRKRVASGDDTVSVKLDELKTGLGLGLSTMGLRNGLLADVNEVNEVDDEDDSDDDTKASLGDDVDNIRLPSSELDEEPVSDDDIFNIKLQPKQRALQEGDGNAKSPRKVSFATDHIDPAESNDENASDVQLVPSEPTKDTTTLEKKAETRKSRIPEPRSREALKRHSSPTPHPDERSPKMTVQEKLDVAQAKADAAAVAVGLRMAEKGTDADEARPTRPSRRKSRITGRPRRRKSTLSPEELGALLGLDD